MSTIVVWILWTEALSHVGYTLLETTEVGESNPFNTSTWVVVSAGDHYDPKLPVSNMTVDVWKAERTRLATDLYRLNESDADEDTSSDGDENITEREDDNESLISDEGAL